jgi:hypothetical protein
MKEAASVGGLLRRTYFLGSPILKVPINFPLSSSSLYVSAASEADQHRPTSTHWLLRHSRRRPGMLSHTRAPSEYCIVPQTHGMPFPLSCLSDIYVLKIELSHCLFQIRPLRVETSQYPRFPKEHIANREQIVYIPFTGRFRRGRGRVVRGSNRCIRSAKT